MHHGDDLVEHRTSEASFEAQCINITFLNIFVFVVRKKRYSRSSIDVEFNIYYEIYLSNGNASNITCSLFVSCSTLFGDVLTTCPVHMSKSINQFVFISALHYVRNTRS